MGVIREHMVGSSEDADSKAAQLLEAHLTAALKRSNKVSFALSGGRTPPRVLGHLKATGVDWSRVVLTFTDERWVLLNHPDSNEGTARRLMAGTPMAAATVSGLMREGQQLEFAPSNIAKELPAACPLPLDIVFLGMGEDGHIASLFPGRPWLNAKPGRLVIADQQPASDAKHARVSMSAETLLAAQTTILVVAGDEKLAVWETARAERDPARLPVAILFDSPETMIVDVVVIRPDAENAAGRTYQ